MAIMKEINIPLNNRPCDSCGGTSLKELWKYAHTTKTRNNKWVFNVHNVICRHCGFVFASPVVDDATLLEYYADSYSKFGQQRLDYSIQKRLEVMDMYLNNSMHSYIEIGSNLKTDFHKKLESRYSSIITVEPNTGTENDYQLINEIACTYD